MTPELRRLAEAARAARERAYAPYSQFAVGAAVLSDDGRTFTGANVENASYGLSICAERAAVFAAVHAGARALSAVAVAGPPGLSTPPCGACRQVLAEFGPSMQVAFGDGNTMVQATLAVLLPAVFSLAPPAEAAPT